MSWITVITAVLYLAAGAMVGQRLSLGIDATSRSRSVPITLAILATVGHAFVLYHFVSAPAGLNLGFFHVLSLTAWMIAVLVLLSSFNLPTENLGIAVYPLAAAAVLLQLLLPQYSTLIATESAGMELHILLSIISASLFTIAAVQAGLLAIQDRHLRNRHPGGFIRALPALETMETLLFRIIGIGYVLLSLALVSGATFLENIFAQHLVHKTVLSIAAWAVFAILLWGRWRHGWRGRTAIRWTLGGFTALLLAYFGSKLVQQLILGR